MTDTKKPKYFGTDGMRGTVGSFPLVPDYIQKIGNALGQLIDDKGGSTTILIGRDTRQSGQMLQSALSAGILSTGVNVHDIGEIPTPAVSYLVKRFHYQAGVVISASHNPHEQNGIKIFSTNGQKMSAFVELEIERLADLEIAHQNPASRIGSMSYADQIRQEYVRDLLSTVDGTDLTGTTITVDCANGAASIIAPVCFSRLGARVICIHAEPDGKNINSNCGSEHVRKYPNLFAKQIKANHAAFGIAFDGDADRVIFTDTLGRVIDGDNILALLADHLNKTDNLSGNTVISSNMRNTGLAAYLQERQIHLIETKVGDKYITEELLKLRDSRKPGGDDIGLGGEQSGHIILMDDDHVSGDGIRTALFLLKIWNERGRPRFHDFVASLAKHPQIIVNAEIANKPELETIPGFSNVIEEMRRSLTALERYDIRYSGTESKLRVMLEADLAHTEDELAVQAYRLCKFVQTATGAENGEIEILNISKGGLITL